MKKRTDAWGIAFLLMLFGLAVIMLVSMSCGKIFTLQTGPSPYRVWCMELEHPWYANYMTEAKDFVDHFTDNLGYTGCVAYTVQGDTIYDR